MYKTAKQERKLVFMKKELKSLIAFMLCAAAIITSVSAGTGTVSAAGKKIPLKAEFNGTEIVLVKNLNGDSREDTKIKTLEKKWGKPKKVKEDGSLTFYTWKKGKTSIEIGNNTPSGNHVGYIKIDIKDKNGSMFGVKVGMKKSEALKKLKKVAGSKNVIVTKDGQETWFDKEENKYVTEGEPTGNGEYISLFSEYYITVNFDLKNDKVKSIYWFRS